MRKECEGCDYESKCWNLDVSELFCPPKGVCKLKRTFVIKND